MKKLGYPKDSSKWIRPYYSLISEYDKKPTTKVFHIPSNENNECTILVTTSIYEISIDNPDIKLVIQWDFSLLFDSMIQQMGHVKRKKGKATFYLFIPKWSKIIDQKEIEEQKLKNSKDRTTANAQLSDKNPPISKMNQKLNVNDNVTNADSDTSSKADSEANLDLENTDEADLISRLLATEANKSRISKKKEYKSNMSDAAKGVNLFNEMFEYIYIAQCQRLYFLACMMICLIPRVVTPLKPQKLCLSFVIMD